MFRMRSGQFEIAASMSEGSFQEMSAATPDDFGSFRRLLGDERTADLVERVAPSAFKAVSDFWRVPMDGPFLSARLKELILVAMHGSATSLDVPALKRHIARAKRAGATDADIVDVLVTVVALANHSLYVSLPIVEEEFDLASGDVATAETWAPDEDYERAKAEFIEARGFWNPDRERLARLVPDYCDVLNSVSTETWTNGPLTLKERSLVCVGIDSMITHSYEPGLRRHIRNAIAEGASRGEVLEVIQLSGLLGLEGYLLGAQAIAEAGEWPAEALL